MQKSPERKSELDKVLGQNTDALMKKLGFLKKKPFAESININDAEFRRLLKGEARWNTWHIEAVAKGLRTKPEFLFNPEMPICKEPPTLNIHPTQKMKKFAGRFARENYFPIPLLKDPIAAGLPAEVTESKIDGWALIYADKAWMPNDPENYTCARVTGYSMSPILEPGDIVAIDHLQREPRPLRDKMVAFRKEGGVTVKWLRIFEEKHMVVGEPENRAEINSTIMLDYDEAYESIVGRVAWWWAKR